MSKLKDFVRIGLATAVACAGSWFFGVAPASAGVGCGSDITQNTTLTHDLTDCPGHGLQVKASNVVLDLGGHTVDGIGGFAAVIVYPNLTGVTVKNGKVQQFDRGIDLLPSDKNATISSIISLNNPTGILVDGNNAAGHKVIGNTFSGGHIGMSISSDNTTVSGNQVNTNTLGGFRLNGDDNVVTNNVFSKNKGSGIVVNGGDRNTITGNQMVQNTVDGIGLVNGAVQNAVSKNSLSKNGHTGVFIGGAELGTAVLNNTSTGNGFDGLLVQGPGSSVKANLAYDNVHNGIEAAAGVIDGGGNKAGGNGGTNCVNILCT